VEDRLPRAATENETALARVLDTWGVSKMVKVQIGSQAETSSTVAAMLSMNILRAASEIVAAKPDAGTSAWGVLWDGLVGSVFGAAFGAGVTIWVFRRTLKYAAIESAASRGESREALAAQVKADLEARRMDRLVAAAADWMSAAERATAEVGTMAMIEYQRDLQSASNRLRIDLIHEDYELSKIVFRITRRIGDHLFAVPSNLDSKDDETAREEAMRLLVQLTSEAAQYLAVLVSAPRGSARHDGTRALFRELAPEPGVDLPAQFDPP